MVVAKKKRSVKRKTPVRGKWSPPPEEHYFSDEYDDALHPPRYEYNENQVFYRPVVAKVAQPLVHWLAVNAIWIVFFFLFIIAILIAVIEIIRYGKNQLDIAIDPNKGKTGGQNANDKATGLANRLMIAMGGGENAVLLLVGLIVIVLVILYFRWGRMGYFERAFWIFVLSFLSGMLFKVLSLPDPTDVLDISKWAKIIGYITAALGSTGAGLYGLSWIFGFFRGGTINLVQWFFSGLGFILTGGILGRDPRKGQRRGGGGDDGGNGGGGDDDDGDDGEPSGSGSDPELPGINFKAGGTFKSGTTKKGSRKTGGANKSKGKGAKSSNDGPTKEQLQKMATEIRKLNEAIKTAGERARNEGKKGEERFRDEMNNILAKVNQDFLDVQEQLKNTESEVAFLRGELDKPFKSTTPEYVEYGLPEWYKPYDAVLQNMMISVGVSFGISQITMGVGATATGVVPKSMGEMLSSLGSRVSMVIPTPLYDMITQNPYVSRIFKTVMGNMIMSGVENMGNAAAENLKRGLIKGGFDPVETEEGIDIMKSRGTLIEPGVVVPDNPPKWKRVVRNVKDRFKRNKKTAEKKLSRAEKQAQEEAARLAERMHADPDATDADGEGGSLNHEGHDMTIHYLGPRFGGLDTGAGDGYQVVGH